MALRSRTVPACWERSAGYGDSLESTADLPGQLGDQFFPNRANHSLIPPIRRHFWPKSHDLHPLPRSGDDSHPLLQVTRCDLHQMLSGISGSQLKLTHFETHGNLEIAYQNHELPYTIGDDAAPLPAGPITSGVFSTFRSTSFSLGSKGRRINRRMT